VPNVNIYVLNI